VRSRAGRGFGRRPTVGTEQFVEHLPAQLQYARPDKGVRTTNRWRRIDDMRLAAEALVSLALVGSLALPASAADPPALRTGIRGKVSSRGSPRPASGCTRTRAPALRSGRGEAVFGRPRGRQYLLRLEPGRYYLVGKRAGSASGERPSPPKGSFSAYHGGNRSRSSRAHSQRSISLVRRAQVSVRQGDGPDVRIEGSSRASRGPRRVLRSSPIPAPPRNSAGRT